MMMVQSVQSVASGNTLNSDLSQVSSLNNNQLVALLTNKSIDPTFAKLLINQMTTNNVNNILFGNPSNGTTTGSNNFDPFAGSEMNPTNISPNNALATTDIFGASGFSNVTPQFQMSVYSSLIGKTVTAVDPATSKQITKKVTSVSLQNNSVVLDLEGTIVPVGSIVKVQ